MPIGEELVRTLENMGMPFEDWQMWKRWLANIDAVSRQVGGIKVDGIAGLSEITTDAGVLLAGEFRSGNNELPGDGFTGVRMGYPGFTYNAETWNLVGINNDALQVGLRASDGKFLAGGGIAVLDEGGLGLHVPGGESSIPANLSWYDTDGNAFIRTFNTFTETAGQFWLIAGPGTSTKEAHTLQIEARGGEGKVYLALHGIGSTSWIELDNADNQIKITQTETVINEEGADVNFRVESDTDPNLIFGDGGTNAVTFGSTTKLGKVGVDGNADEVQFAVQAHSSQTANIVEIQDSGGGDLVVIRGDGRIGARVSSPTRIIDAIGRSASGGADEDGFLIKNNYISNFDIQTYSSLGASISTQFRFKRARGDISSPSVISDGDRIGSIPFHGHDGTDLLNTGFNIVVEANGAVASNSVPMTMMFEAQQEGDTTRTEFIRIGGTEVVVNETGADDVDFRVEGNTEANLLRVDAGTDTIRMGDWDTNYAQFAVDGELTLVGTARIMRSIDLEPVLATRPAANPPGEGTEDSFPTHDFNASTEESVYFHLELPHDYAAAGTIHAHFDFFVDTAPASAESVVWGVEYKKLSIGDNFDFGAGTTTAYTQTSITTGTPANDKKVHQSAEISLTTTGFVAGDYILLRLFRDADGTGGTDDYTADARVLDYHVEYLSDRLGEAT